MKGEQVQNTRTELGECGEKQQLRHNISVNHAKTSEIK